MEELLEEPILGLMPRLLAAGWFGLAGSIPVAVFFYVFGATLRVEDLWMFGVLPVIIAAYFGFTIGAWILSPAENNNGAKAIGLGLLVAFASYFTLAGIDLTVTALATFPPTEKESYLYPLGVPVLFLYGLLFIGWLVALAGALAGAWLFWIALNPALDEWLIRQPVWHRRNLRVAHAVALLLLIVSCLPAYVSTRESRNAELREREKTVAISPN